MEIHTPITAETDMDDQCWNVVAQLLRNRLNEAENAANEMVLRVELIMVTTVVYQRRGEQHPSEYGIGTPLNQLQKDLEQVRKAIQQWTRCLQLVEAASTPQGESVVQYIE